MIKYLVLFSLIAASFQIDNCETLKTVCSQCISGFRLVNLEPNGTICINETKITEIQKTKEGCVKVNADKCTLCQRNYVLFDGKTCKNIAHCQKANGDMCEKCYDPFLLDNGGTCEQNVRCIRSEGKKCAECIKKYYPDAEGKCPKIPIDHCSEGTKDTCSNCENLYFLEDNKCKPYPEHCNSLNSENKCNGCESLFYLENEQCKPYPSHCTSVNSENKCNGCERLFYLENEQCKPYPEHCNSLNSENKCNGCDFYYYLNNEACTKIPIDNCKVLQDDKTKCQECDEKSERSDDETKCLITCQAYADICTKCKNNYQSYDYGKTCEVIDPDLVPPEPPKPSPSEDNKSRFINFDLAAFSLILLLIL